MTVHTAAVTLAYVGACLGVVMVVPQIVRILRHPSLGGVSAPSWALTALACLTWLIYGVRTQTLPQIPGNVLLVCGAVAIVVLVPGQVSARARALRLGAAAALVVTVALGVPARSVGYLAFAVGLLSAWPQVFDSVAGWRAGGSSGVSISTWAIKVCSQTCWLTYAVATGDGPVTISATVALSTAVALVVVESSRRSLAGRRSVALEPA
jgi:uncharacterized protein with PQ loop repeat